MAKVLIATNDLEVLACLEAEITAEDHEVVHAPDGHDALTMAAASPPDLVMLDKGLDVMSAEEVCGELRQDPDQIPALSIVLLTDEDVSPTHLEAHGFSAVFPKTHGDLALRAFLVEQLRLRQPGFNG